VRPITDQDTGLKIVHDGTEGTDPLAVDNIEYATDVKEKRIINTVTVSLPFMAWEHILMIPGAKESEPEPT
jgi:hypothetical protein